MEDILFVLLRLGLDMSSADTECLSDFILLPRDRWGRIGEMAQKQGVLGIVVDGIDQIEKTRYGLTVNQPTSMKLEWIGQVLQIEQKNIQQTAVMNDMAKRWSDAGCRVMVMKGQANGTMYPKPEHRNPGDIDCFLFESYARGNEIAREAGADVDESWYKHSVISYKEETFENHQYFVHTRDGSQMMLRSSHNTHIFRLCNGTQCFSPIMLVLTLCQKVYG